MKHSFKRMLGAPVFIRGFGFALRMILYMSPWALFSYSR